MANLTDTETTAHAKALQAASEAGKRPLRSAEDETKQAVCQLLLDSDYITRVAELVAAAKRRIWVTAFTWRWYEKTPERGIQQFNYNMALQSKRGCDIRAIVHSDAQKQILSAYGINTRVLPTQRVMHTKALLIDDNFLVLGSHNLTERGTNENFEASIVCSDPAVCLEFEEYFARLWQQWSV